MVTQPVILGDLTPNHPNFYILHCLSVCEYRDFKFSVQVDHSKSSMEQIKKPVAVCASVYVSVICLCAPLRMHFLIDFHQNRHRRRNTQK